MKFSIKDFFHKYDQVHGRLRIWSHLPKKSFMENLILCEVFQKQNLNQKTVADYSFSYIPETYTWNENLRILREHNLRFYLQIPVPDD